MSLDKITGLRVKIDEDTYSDPYEFRTFAENVLLNRETDSDTVEEVFNKYLFRNGLSNVDLNDVITPGFYGCATAANSATITNKPMGLNDTEFVMQVLQIDAIGNKIQQILTSMNSGAIWTRSRTASGSGGYTWTIWTGSYGASSVIPSNSNLDNYIEPGVYVSQNADTSATITNAPTTSYGFVVLVFSLGKDTTGRVQLVLQAGAGRSKMWTRTRSGSTWTQWVNYNFFGLPQFQIAADTDLNTLTTTGSYRCNSGTIAATLINCPTKASFLMDVRHSISSNYLIQTIYNYTADCSYRRRITLSNGAFSSAGAWNWIQNYKVVTAWDENDNITVGTLDNVIQYCRTNYSPVDVIHSFYFQGGTDALYGTASFTVLSKFTSTNYGWIMCFSDRQTQTPIHIAYSSGNYMVNRLEAPTDNSYLKQLTASDNLFTLTPGHYRIYNALPTNIPNDIDPAQKYGYVTVYYENSYTYYDLVAGKGDFSNQDRWLGWKDASSSSISWSCLTKGRRIGIAENTDLNDLTIPGIYASATGTTSSSLVNKPQGLGNALFVMQVYQIDAPNNQLLQHIMSGGSGGQSWIRYKTGTIWSGWTNMNSFYLPNSGLTQDTDLNTITDIGTYRCTTVAISKSLGNCPIQQPFILQVRWSRTSSVKMQVLWEYTGKNIWIRSVTKGTEADWTDATFGEWQNPASVSMLKQRTTTTLTVGETIKFTPGSFCYIICSSNSKDYLWTGIWIGTASKIIELLKNDNISVSETSNGFTITNNNSASCYVRIISPYDVTFETVDTELVIAKQPQSIVVIPDEEISFSLIAKNATSYRWKYSSNGGTTWGNIPTEWDGYASNSLTFIATESRANNLYRCEVSDGTNTIYSNSVNFIRKTVIVKQPQDIQGNVEDTATLAIEAQGKDLTYQWQYLNSGAASYVNYAGTGYNTSEITLELAQSMADSKWRCIVSGTGGTQTSEIATITIGIIPEQPEQEQIVQRKILFIGDSYCEGYSHNGNNSGWAWYCGQYLGLNGTIEKIPVVVNGNTVQKDKSDYNTPNTNNAAVDSTPSDDFERMYRGGARFYWSTYTTGYTFYQLLNEAHVRFPNYVFTDIVVCGGYNDRLASMSQIIGAIEEFVNQAKTYYPNVNIYVGHIGFNKKGSSADPTVAPPEWLQYRKHMKDISIPAYKECTRFGATYLTNVEYALNENLLTVADGYHPGEAGNRTIARAVAEALTRGSASINYTDAYYYYTSQSKRYLFMGDSYCEGWTKKSANYNEGWAKYCGDALGLKSTISAHGSSDPSNAANSAVDTTPNDDYERIYVGGARFYHTNYNTGKTFYELIIKAHDETFPDYDFTDIVACAGFGDRNSTEINISSGIQDFCQKANELYPGARIHIGCISSIKKGNDATVIDDANWVTARNNLKDHVLPAYQRCAAYGARYLTNVEFAINDKGLMDDDGYCANEQGNRNIGIAIANALLTGSAPFPSIHKKYLFLGDAQLAGYSTVNTDSNSGWGIFCGDALNLKTTMESSCNGNNDTVNASSNDDYEILYYYTTSSGTRADCRFGSGSSTQDSTFKALITKAPAKFPRYKFTDIVACGGFGDRAYSSTVILTGIQEFCDKAKQLYPDANIYIGCTGFAASNIENANRINSVVLPTYQKCSQYGARYLNNVQCWIGNNGLSSDGYSINQIGNKNLGYAIANALRTGSAPLPPTYKPTYKKYLFLGDAQLAGYSTVSTDSNSGWGIFCGNALNLSTTGSTTSESSWNGNNNTVNDSLDDDYEILYYYTTSSGTRADCRFGSGSSTQDSTFKALIDKAPIKFPDCNFTDIVVCGGFGDRAYSSTVILTGIQDFCNRAKQLYPNANIYIGCTGFADASNENITNVDKISSVVIPTYQKCSQYGARYLNNVQYWLGIDQLSSDGYSVKQTGNKNLGYAIANALRTGSAPLPYKDNYRIS